MTAKTNMALFTKKRVFEKLGFILTPCPDNIECQEIKESVQDDVLFALHALLSAEHNLATRKHAAKNVLSHVYHFLASPVQPVSRRACACDIINMLLEKCRANCELLSHLHPPIELIGILESCTDYMIQSVVFEIMYRLSLNSSVEQLCNVLRTYDQQCAKILCDPGDDFVAATRAFLLAFNSGMGRHQRIFSLLRAGDKEAQWVDFGVAEMVLWDEKSNITKVIPYKDVERAVADGPTLQLVWRNKEQTPARLQFRSDDAQLLTRCVTPRITSYSLMMAQGDPKCSIVTVPIPHLADAKRQQQKQQEQQPVDHAKENSSSSQSPSVPMEDSMMGPPMTWGTLLQPNLTDAFRQLGDALEARMKEERIRGKAVSDALDKMSRHEHIARKRCRDKILHACDTLQTALKALQEAVGEDERISEAQDAKRRQIISTLLLGEREQ